MAFNISSLYVEVDISFPISHKVDQLILDKMISNLPRENQQIVKNGQAYDLGVIVSTKKQIIEMSIQGPSFSKKYKMVDYTLWLPYSKIIKAQNILEAYLDFVTMALQAVFQRNAYPTDIIKKVMNEVKSEVLDNPDYEYSEKADGW
jgi:hypothetical protein